ncbi:MAG: 23S rRNA (pseudouridine(1915)-N(3))-methyltransferase RlmH [Desulfobulbaceae bacterium]|nr:23S rRNA (pseudouridine(1915)-N(3))-methyltransferase RlmH [Desulfobulbaceae bacterium]
MKHELLFLGREKEGFLAEGVREYAARLRHYAAVEITVLKEKRKSSLDEAALVTQETDRLLAAVRPGALLVALDGHGESLTSFGLADLLSRWEHQGVKLVNYLIGGPLGLSEHALARADVRLSLSRLTFTHDMARLILLEQLYRAYTIKAGEKYHK